MTDKALIRLDNIAHCYGTSAQKVWALRGISISIFQGEFVAIAGPSGSGKTTLLHIIGCLLRPTGGSYWLNGNEISLQNRSQLAKIRNQEIGFVFQTFSLLPRGSALQNVGLPLVYSGVGRRERNRRARKLLERVGLGARVRHRPNELSGGEQQRVAIARSLVNRPRVILADEPTGNLDRETGASIMDLFDELVSDGITVALVTHNPEILERAPRRIRLEDGQLAQQIVS